MFITFTKMLHLLLTHILMYNYFSLRLRILIYLLRIYFEILRINRFFKRTVWLILFIIVIGTYLLLIILITFKMLTSIMITILILLTFFKP